VSEHETARHQLAAQRDWQIDKDSPLTEQIKFNSWKEHVRD
jgi:hypothetical protein